MSIAAAATSILTVNSGSSSLKFALFDPAATLHTTHTGRIERIGTPDAVFSVQSDEPGQSFTRPVVAGDHAAAVTALMAWIAAHEQDIGLAAIGHRVVHGGPRHHAPQRIDAALLADLRALVPLDPAHLPDAISTMAAFGERFAHLPQFACFDTAFHHDLPRVARLLPIPRRYETQGLRRYGFHGLSYTFLMEELRRQEGAESAHGRVILAHLGNGASLAAVHQGRPVDTSMGLTPASGVPMATRAGDLDPGLAWYLARTEGLDAQQFNDLVNTRSGLLGMSETSGDLRELLRRETGDVRAAEAVAVFCYQVRKSIGALAAALGGVDHLVFSGGIGENLPEARTRICNGLAFLGITLDDVPNAAGAGRISTRTSRVKVHVIRTNEELVIARAVCRLLGLDATPPSPAPP